MTRDDPQMATDKNPVCNGFDTENECCTDVSDYGLLLQSMHKSQRPLNTVKVCGMKLKPTT